MYTQDQLNFMNEITQMVQDQGEKFAVGYLSSLAAAMLATVKTRTQQKAFISQIKDFNDSQPVEVKNLMTGAQITIPRGAVGTCIDPSTERYWSM